MEETIGIKLDYIEKETLGQIREIRERGNFQTMRKEVGSDGRKRKYFYKSKPIIARKIMYRLGVPKKSLSKWVDCIGIHLSHSKKVKMVKNIQKEAKKNE